VCIIVIIARVYCLHTCMLFKAIGDSSRYVGMIKDLGKLWGHLKEGYGRLIACYAKLIIQKINFHRKVSLTMSLCCC